MADSTAWEYHRDPETLHEVAHHPAALAAELDRPGLDDTRVGFGALILGDVERARRHLTAALAADPDSWPTRLHCGRAELRAGRVVEAARLYAQCAASVPAGDEHAAALQDALGGLHHHLGDWTAASTAFVAAMRLHSGNQHAVDTSRAAANTAHACLTANQIGRVCERLIPAVHLRAAATGGPEIRLRHDAPPEAGYLTELRTPLLAGPVPLAVVERVYQHLPSWREAVDVLLDTGWLMRVDDAVAVTDAGRALVVELAEHLDAAAAAQWPDIASDVAVLAHAAAVSALSDPAGPGSAGWSVRAVTGAAGVAEAVTVLHRHRADAITAAATAVGLDPGEARALPDDDPRHVHITAVADRTAARAYRPLSPAQRQVLADGLRALPS